MLSNLYGCSDIVFLPRFELNNFNF